MKSCQRPTPITPIAFAVTALVSATLLVAAQRTHAAEADGNGTQLLPTKDPCGSCDRPIAQGDEVLGFTRSFLSAGSSSLIASLWPVSDDATAVLMSTLYGELSKGRDIQKAMQAGQLAVLKDPKMSHPFFWAPFNLIGNWRLTVGG